jgi:ABC-type Zn uptake system ZnuABC Zn-binding protein ZnuA
MTPPRSIFALSTAVFACTLVAAGCGSGSDSGESNGKPVVVATTTQLADFAREVGGDEVVVKQILGPNADPHEYEPRPSDAAAMADADLVLQSGGDLDEWLDGVIDNAGGDAKVVDLIDSVKTREGEGETDPHWWQDPRNAEAAVAEIERAMTDADPDAKAALERNAKAYTRSLEELDARTAACIDQLPRASRRLVTTHDALGYYADRYGLEVIGALIPSLSTEAQPNAKDTRKLVDQIEETGTKAVFPESSVNPKLEEAVARETDATIGKPLYADTLGPKGSAGGTYIDSIDANTRAIASGLSGGQVHCG